MLQRIQTVYLAISTLLFGLLLFIPLGEIAFNDQIFTFFLKGVINSSTNSMVYNGWPLLVMLFVVIIFQIVVIFNYKKRKQQIMMTSITILLIIGFILVCWFFTQASLKQIGGGVYAFKLGMSFPIVACILNYLAIRSIKKDEALIRSIDRIR